MARVIVSFVEEHDETGPVFKYIEGEYKKVKWDGQTLTIGNKKIITRELSTYGLNDILLLVINGEIYIKRLTPEEIKAEEERRAQRRSLQECFEIIKKERNPNT